jgi:hypothetical protein
MERALVQAQIVKLLDASLVKLSKGEYVSTTMMPTKKDILGNSTKHRMCGDYCPMNKWTYSNKYAMPQPKEIFDALGHVKVFSTLDLKSCYH